MTNYNICIKSRGKKHPLSYNFSNRSQAAKHVKIKNENITRFTIGGRGFKSRHEAVKWKQMALKNPPLGYTKEIYDKILKIEPKIVDYKYEVCK